MILYTVNLGRYDKASDASKAGKKKSGHAGVFHRDGCYTLQIASVLKKEMAEKIAQTSGGWIYQLEV